MLKDGERYVLTTGKPSVIRDLLSLVLAEARCEGDRTPGSRERLEAFTSRRCDRLILDLRTTEELPGGISPRVRNLRVSHIGRVLVVTGVVARSRILHEIEALRRPRFSPQPLTTTLLAVVHMLLRK